MEYILLLGIGLMSIMLSLLVLWSKIKYSTSFNSSQMRFASWFWKAAMIGGIYCILLFFYEVFIVKK